MIRPVNSNIGVSGVSSIRLNGQRIEDLPIAEGARAKEQIPEAQEAERKSKVASVKARYPKHRVDYLVGRIRECENNKTRVRRLRDEQNAKINEYTATIALCDHREKEEAKIATDDPDREMKLHELRKQFPPYNAKAMRQQIEQFQAGVLRCDEVIATEDESIREFSEVLALCKRRDEELRNLGE